MTDAPESRVSWFVAKDPAFSMTTEGELKIEFSPSMSGLEIEAGRMGLLIPAESTKILLRHLQELRTIQETLSAKRPKPGAH